MTKTELDPQWADALGRVLGKPVSIESVRPVGGGCINSAARLETSEGYFFVKYGQGQFSSEARQLDMLEAAAGPSINIPSPLAYRDGEAGQPGFLITRFLESGRPARDFDETLGQGLAEIHRSTASAFGFAFDTYCGSTLQPNSWTENWVSFYGESRLAHQLRLLANQGKLNQSGQKAFTRVIERLDTWLGDDEGPALIHGDLWSGNLLVSAAGGPALIDPAAYYAHREAELGMTTLFGGFSDRVYAAYHEAWPLRSGWRERNPLYQLWHVANHATLFGGSYVDQTLRILHRFA